MAEGLTQEENETGNSENGSRKVGAAVMNATQDAAGVVRAKLPDAVAGAQVAATETQRRLDEMPNQALLMGTSFSLGLGLGLFLSGANRLLVALALAPAGAMALTMSRRDDESAATPIGNRRASRSSVTAE